MSVSLCFSATFSGPHSKHSWGQPCKCQVNVSVQDKKFRCYHPTKIKGKRRRRRKRIKRRSKKKEEEEEEKRKKVQSIVESINNYFKKKQEKKTKQKQKTKQSKTTTRPHVAVSNLPFPTSPSFQANSKTACTLPCLPNTTPPSQRAHTRTLTRTHVHAQSHI